MPIAEGGRVTSLESDPRRIAAAREFLGRDPAGARVDSIEGDAGLTTAGLTGPFDLIYIDADKTGCPRCVELALDRLAPGGLVLIDDLLTDGAVAIAEGDGHWSQASVNGARRLNAGPAADSDLTFLLLPVGDGIGVVQRT